MVDEELNPMPCPVCEGTEWDLVVGTGSGDIEAICADPTCSAGVPLFDEDALGDAQQDGAEWVAEVAERIADALQAGRGVGLGDVAALRHLATFVRASRVSSTAAKELADAFGIDVAVLNEPEEG